MNKIAFILVGIFSLIFIIGCKTDGEIITQEGSISINPSLDLPKEEFPEQEESSFTGEIREFNINAKKFDFTSNVINVNQGDKVKLTLTSLDVTHGFSIEE